MLAVGLSWLTQGRLSAAGWPALSEPMSAATLAAASGLPRQRVNYHLRELERHGLVKLIEERRNMTERVMQSTARSFVISPAALAAVAPDPSRSPDRLSASWLLAVVSQLVRDVGILNPRRQRRRRSWSRRRRSWGVRPDVQVAVFRAASNGGPVKDEPVIGDLALSDGDALGAITRFHLDELYPRFGLAGSWPGAEQV